MSRILSTTPERLAELVNAIQNPPALAEMVESRIEKETPGTDVERREYDRKEVPPDVHRHERGGYYEGTGPQGALKVWPAVVNKTTGSWRSHTPTRKVYKYPPAKDNPGRVSEVAARDMRNRAEAHHIGSQAEIVAGLRSMKDKPTKAQRKARRSK